MIRDGQIISDKFIALQYFMADTGTSLKELKDLLSNFEQWQLTGVKKG